ncbi:flagellar biosynthetic protein FliO [Halobacillus rhizosphaerae]|uniref:flagellar biosynthetic protein FliO n=1 Tax=Halobacillus rhizosphaerae TaxID=3064889 RepID=UPI00398A8EF8
MFQSTRMTTVCLLLFLSFFMSSSAVWAAGPSVSDCTKNPELDGCASQSDDAGKEDGNEKKEGVISSSSSREDQTAPLIWSIVRLVFVLILVLALIYGLLKFFNSKNKLMNRNRTMENLGGMNLAPNRSIQAVRIGTQVFILGVGDSVEIITEITNEETKEHLLNREEGNLDQVFGMKKWLTKFNKKDRQPKDHSSTVQFQQMFEKQLNEMKEKRKEWKKEKKEKKEGRDYE